MPEDVLIGIDLGGTRVRAARLDSELQIQQRVEAPTHAADGESAIIQRMIEQARAVWPTDGAHVKGVGISAPGPVNPRKGLLVAPPNLPGWHNVPLAQLLQEALNVPVFLGNDANLAALAETHYGAAKGYDHVIYLTISTGIGSGVISAGHMVIGSTGIGAECGHLILIAEEGRISTLEKEAAGLAIARQAREAIQSGEKSAILTYAGGSVEAVTAVHVTEAARAGDALALRLLDRAGRMVGLGIVSLLHTFNPQIVVIGGGVADGAGDLLAKPMHATIEQYAIDRAYWENLIIASPALGENVSIIGAGALAAGHGE
jgi:glucokinase